MWKIKKSELLNVGYILGTKHLYYIFKGFQKEFILDIWIMRSNIGVFMTFGHDTKHKAVDRKI